MKELSLNILDIAQNSLKAEASLVTIELLETETELTITIRDDGKGMSPEMVKSAINPFSTTRTTRKVGMGLPLLKLAAEQTGGTMTLTSTSRELDPEHAGTTVTALFHKDHMDFTPLGDVVGTVTILIQGSPETDFLFLHTLPGGEVRLDTREIREVLGPDVSLAEYEVLEWIRESLTEQYAEANPA